MTTVSELIAQLTMIQQIYGDIHVVVETRKCITSPDNIYVANWTGLPWVCNEVPPDTDGSKKAVFMGINYE